MGKIACQRCGHENDVGARICASCYARLGESSKTKRRLGLCARLASIPLGTFVPIILVLVFFLLLMALSPTKATWQNVMVQFGLLGLVALGVTFPLTKGQYDLSCGPVAGLAACVTILATHGEQMLTLPVGVTAALAGILVGVAAGFVSGIIVGWSRLHSALFTLILAVAATDLTHTIALRRELVLGDPAFQALGEAQFAGLPAPLLLLLAAALAGVLLFRRETFWPLNKATTAKWNMRLSRPQNIMWSFVASGLLAGLAGVFIAGCGLPVTSPTGHATWILAPLTAAMLGGAVVSAGMGGVSTALMGAAALTLISSFLNKLQVPIAGPVAEALILFALLATGRTLSLTWYELQELRRGNLLGIPAAQRLPELLFHSRYSRAIWACSMVVIGLLTYAYVAYFRVQYVPDDAALVVSYSGTVEAYELQEQRTIPLAIAERMLLESGHMVVTRADGECLLRFSDDTQVQLSNNTSMTISQIAQEADGTRQVKLRMSAGRLWGNVQRLITRDSIFEVDTPLLTVAVRGTLFEVELVEDAAKVGVLHGALNLYRFLTTTDRYGRAVSQHEQRDLREGEGLVAWADEPMGSAFPLPELQRDRMRRLSEQAASELGRALFGMAFLKAIGGLVLLSVCIYLIIMYAAAGPVRVVMPEDVAEAARRVEASRTRTADDSPRSVALAQMYLRTGNKTAARDELEKIIAVDPNSEHGQWAKRMLAMLMEDQDEEGDS